MGGKDHTGPKRHTGIDRRPRPALYSAFNGTADTHTHMGGKHHTGHKRHTGIGLRRRPALHTAFNGTAHTQHKDSKDHTGHKSHTGIDRRRWPALHTAFNGTAHTHTAHTNRIDSSTWTDSSAGTGSSRASPGRGHNGTHHRINPGHPRHNVGERLCRRPCQPVVSPLYKRLCQYAGAPAQMPGTPLSLSYTLHEKDGTLPDCPTMWDHLSLRRSHSGRYPTWWQPRLLSLPG